MDLMLFTVYHITEIFLRKESGFSRDSITSALLLFHAESLGILCVTEGPGILHGLEEPRPWLISTFPVWPNKSCHSLGAAATLGTAGRWKIHLFVSASKILWCPKSLHLGHQHPAAGDGAALSSQAENSRVTEAGRASQAS